MQNQQEQQQQSLPIVHPQDVYFIPPPINQFNKTYYQQLSNIDNPIQHATKSYVSFSQLYKLSQPESQQRLQSKMITEKYRKQLLGLNRSLFQNMKDFIKSLAGFSPISQIRSSTQPEIKDQIVRFMLQIQAIKKYQIRVEVCKKIQRQTNAIKARTSQIIEQLQKVKDNFSNALVNNNESIKIE